MILGLNTILLLLPALGLEAWLRKGRRHFLPFAWLYVLTSAFLAFMALYLLGLKVAPWGLWAAYYVSAAVCAILVRLLWRGLNAEDDPLSSRRFDRYLLGFVAVATFVTFAVWHYIPSSASGMYYIWLDACRFFKDAGMVYPALPATGFVDSYLSPMALNPVGVPVLELLASGLSSHLLFHVWGIFIALCYIGFLLALCESSFLLFKNRSVGVLAYALFFVKDPGGINWLKVNLEVGSHQAPFFYGAALLFLCWSMVWRRAEPKVATLFAWPALAFIAIRPYLAAFVGALAGGVILILLRRLKTSFFGSLFRRTFIQAFSIAITLGFMIFSWQIWLFARYGSLVTYSRNEFLKSLASYGVSLPGGDLGARLATFWANIGFFFPSLINRVLSLNKSSLGYTLLPIAVFSLLLAALLGWGLRVSLNRKSRTHTWITSLVLVFILFFVFSLAINVDHWKTVAAWVVVFYLIAAASLLLVLGDRPLAQTVTRAAAAVLFLATVFLPLVQKPWTHLNELGRDPFRAEMSRFIRDKGGDVMVVRIEPGADAYYEVPGKYYWDLRFLWNDVDRILKKEQWDAERIVRVLRKQNVRWIYQTLSWDLVNYAGPDTMKNLKDITARRPDLFPLILEQPPPDERRLYEILLPGERASK
jgi:hypothetical protein